MGHTAMKKMANSKILISGMSGLGAEISKNVILSGMKKVCLHDRVSCTDADLSSHFYLTPADKGKNRATACLDKMRELNKYVEVTASEVNDFEEPDFLEQFDVVVLVDHSLETMLKVC